jgi:DNA polymerase-4
VIWPRAIVLVDMNAFFASIEQRDRPEWRGRPVAITNGRQGTCIITCSYEARAYGIKTGMRLKKARRLCPELI